MIKVLLWLVLAVFGLVFTFFGTIVLDNALNDRVSNWIAVQLQSVPGVRSWAQPALTLGETGNTFTNQQTTLYWFLSSPIKNIQDHELQVTLGEKSIRTSQAWKQMRGPVIVALEAGQRHGDLRIGVGSSWNPNVNAPQCDSYSQTVQAEARIVRAESRTVAKSKKLLRVDTMPPMVDLSKIYVNLSQDREMLRLQIQHIEACDNVSITRLLKKLKVPYRDEVLFSGADSPEIPLDKNLLAASESFVMLLTIMDGVGNELPVEITCQKEASPLRTEYLCHQIDFAAVK